MRKHKRVYAIKSFILTLTVVVFGFILNIVGNIVANNPPKIRNYSIYLYGEVHAGEKLYKKNLICGMTFITITGWDIYSLNLLIMRWKLWIYGWRLTIIIISNIYTIIG